MAVNPYDCQGPFVQEERKADVERWQELLGERLSLEEESPSYENVVLWVFQDKVDGVATIVDWQLLYALPEAFGISCCEPEYVKENFDELKSRYLFTAAAGEIDALCAQAGFEKVGEAGGMVLYQRFSEPDR